LVIPRQDERVQVLRMFAHSVSRAFAGIVLAATASCGRSETPAAQSFDSLAELAVQWSAGRTDPTCQRYGATGEYLGPNTDYCQWPTVVRGRRHSTVAAHRDSTIGYTALFWDRTFTDSVEAALVKDSLTNALRALHYHERRCAWGKKLWEGDKLTVILFGPPADQPNSSMKVMVMGSRLTPDLGDCMDPPRDRKPRPNA
jgi:hypothetical protein